MQGKVELVDTKVSKQGKTYYVVTIAGVKGSSFDKAFADNQGNVVEYETETKGEFTNHKFLKAQGATPSVKPTASVPSHPIPTPITAGDIKLLLIPKALECAINGAKLTIESGLINTDQICRVADAYLTWMMKKAE